MLSSVSIMFDQKRVVLVDENGLQKVLCLNTVRKVILDDAVNYVEKHLDIPALLQKRIDQEQLLLGKELTEDDKTHKALTVDNERLRQIEYYIQQKAEDFLDVWINRFRNESCVTLSRLLWEKL